MQRDLKQLWFTKGKSSRGLVAHAGTEELAPQRGLQAALGLRWEGGGPSSKRKAFCWPVLFTPALSYELSGHHFNIL